MTLAARSRLLLIVFACAVPRFAFLAFHGPDSIEVYPWMLSDNLLQLGTLTFGGAPDASNDPLYPFVAMRERPAGVVRFREDRLEAERVATGPTLFRGAVSVPDGRYLITERLGTTSHVLVKPIPTSGSSI